MQKEDDVSDNETARIHKGRPNDLLYIFLVILMVLLLYELMPSVGAAR